MRAMLMAVLFAPLMASAQIYKCTGSDGKINFTDSPCGAETKAEQLESAPPQGLDKLYIEIKEKRKAHAKWSAEHDAREAQLAGRARAKYTSRRMREGLRIGMTEGEVEAIPHWRGAESRNVTETVFGVREQRVFRVSDDNEYEQMYLYFDNGVLTTIQD